MVIMQPSLDINKSPRSFVLMIIDFMNKYPDSTYEYPFEFKIQWIQLRNGKSPNELATFNLNKKISLSLSQDCIIIQQKKY